MINRYGQALERAQRTARFVDLINTNFHSCGLYPPAEPLAATAERYLGFDTRTAYAPDPAGDPALRTAIGAWYTAGGWATSPDDITVTASASESYSHVFSALVEPGSEIALPIPGYPLFEEVARRRGLRPRFYALAEDPWRLDPSVLAETIGSRTGCIVLISPNNPNGASCSDGEIDAVAELAGRHNALLLVDEVFSEFRYTGAALPRPGARHPNLPVCTINGASKLFASPDLKVSWIRTSGTEQWRSEAKEKLEIENDLYLNGSPFSQALVSALFAQRGTPGALAAEVNRRRAVLEQELARINAALAEAGSSISLGWSSPAGGIHLPVRISGTIGIDDEELCVRSLDDYALNLHPGYLYGIETGVVVILSFLNTPERLRAGAERLGNLLLTL